MGSKLKKIMKMKKSENDKEDREINLRKYAKELGVSLEGLSIPNGKFLEAKLVSRIINTERSYREHRLWIVALLSCITSVLSALAAWFAVLRYMSP